MLWAIIPLLSVAISLRSASAESAATTNTTAPPLPTSFAILLFPTYQLLDVFGPLDALTFLISTHHLTLTLISTLNTTAPITNAPRHPSMNPHNSNFYPSLLPTHTLATAPRDIDVLVPGGLGTRAPDLDGAVSFVRERYPRLQHLIAICTGAGLAARAGVLDGRVATTNKGAWNATTALGPGVRWQWRARWTRDGNLWTSNGVSAGLDATLAWMGDVYGSETAEQVARDMEYVWGRDGWDDPFAV
ncbi:hypothetical protein GTA08_BOTSDO12308 [Botryosphaeria dothidea]|uniref:DJ-1/PfpI domain-containing protein n=1 Tax=Botryosphaeria dothidea TaxID=55169 RepID=A0A8H4NAK6_9PEZI|nr:hypothetical protein GTA08_BOTSDO12308 [Botryosphaeria dothidea]